MVNTRQFNRRIIVEQPRIGNRSTVDEKMYGPTRSWEPLGSGGIWASVEPVGGGEQVRNEGVRSGTKYRIRLRFHPAIDERCRVLLPDPAGSASGLPSIGNGLYGRTLDIISVIDEGGRRQVLELICQDNQTTI